MLHFCFEVTQTLSAGSYCVIAAATICFIECGRLLSTTPTGEVSFLARTLDLTGVVSSVHVQGWDVFSL